MTNSLASPIRTLGSKHTNPDTRIYLALGLQATLEMQETKWGKWRRDWEQSGWPLQTSMALRTQSVLNNTTII
jgi:hypothetical protein